MTWPLGDLITAASALLTTAGDTTPTFEGAEYLKNHHSPPRYVWFPDTDNPDSGVRTTNNKDCIRAAAGVREGFQVRCWGENHDETTRIRNNMMWALFSAGKLGGYGLAFEASRWLRPDERGANERGRVYVLRATIGTRIPASYTPPAGEPGDQTTITVGATEIPTKNLVTLGEPPVVEPQ